MGNSSCVECGECMLSCPTTALTFREPVEKSDWFLEQVGGENPVTGERHPGVPGKSAVTPAEMDENELLRTLPWRYREWNQYSVVRWRLKPGEELCRAGDYGATAFLLQSGTFEVVRASRRADSAHAAGPHSGRNDVPELLSAQRDGAGPGRGGSVRGPPQPAVCLAARAGVAADL